MGKLTDIREDTAVVRPQTEAPAWLGAIGVVAGTVVVGGGLYLAVVGATPRATAGATRSSHVQWEERRLEIELAAEEQDAQTAEEQDESEDAQ